MSTVIKHPGPTPSAADTSHHAAIQNILGRNVAITPGIGRNLDVIKHSNPHAMTSIPYAINGTSRVVETKVTEWLAGYNDPIKLLLGTHIQKTNRVVIKRKHVVGQSAIITPEHAPAQSVAVQEEVTEVVRLARYGGDLELNLNLFLVPEEAQTEFEMKLTAQKNALQTQLTKLGYDQLMKNSMNLVELISNQKGVMAAEIDKQMIFGAMAKHPFPIPNLMAAAAQVGAYNVDTVQKPVLLMPQGMLDLVKYTRPDSMKYCISGFSQSDNKRVYMENPGVFYDEQMGVRIAISKRHPDTFGYQANAHRQYHSSHFARDYLSEKVTIYIKYEALGHHCDWENPGSYTHGAAIYKLEVMMGSAILCTNPGPDSGEMLFAFPSTSVSTDKQNEIMKVQLRVYLGAALYQRENYVRFPRVSFESCKVTKINVGNADRWARDFLNNDNRKADEHDPDNYNHIVLKGTCYDRHNDTGKFFIRNDSATNMLGSLDHPDNFSRVFGLQYYSNTSPKV